MWMLRKAESNYLESFKMLRKRKMEKIKWTHKVTNEEQKVAGKREESQLDWADTERESLLYDAIEK